MRVDKQVVKKSCTAALEHINAKRAKYKADRLASEDGPVEIPDSGFWHYMYLIGLWDPNGESSESMYDAMPLPEDSYAWGDKALAEKLLSALTVCNEADPDLTTLEASFVSRWWGRINDG